MDKYVKLSSLFIFLLMGFVQEVEGTAIIRKKSFIAENNGDVRVMNSVKINQELRQRRLLEERERLQVRPSRSAYEVIPQLTVSELKEARLYCLHNLQNLVTLYRGSIDKNPLVFQNSYLDTISERCRELSALEKELQIRLQPR